MRSGCPPHHLPQMAPLLNHPLILLHLYRSSFSFKSAYQSSSTSRHQFHGFILASGVKYSLNNECLQRRGPAGLPHQGLPESARQRLLTRFNKPLHGNNLIQTQSLQRLLPFQTVLPPPPAPLSTRRRPLHWWEQRYKVPLNFNNSKPVSKMSNSR
jgi:hypothetical protein